MRPMGLQSLSSACEVAVHKLPMLCLPKTCKFVKREVGEA